MIKSTIKTTTYSDGSVKQVELRTGQIHFGIKPSDKEKIEKVAKLKKMTVRGY